MRAHPPHRKECPSRLVLERIAAGELGTTAHVAGCDSCRTELVSLQDEAVSLRADPHFAAARHRLAAAAAEQDRRRIRSRWLAALIAPVTATALVVLLLVRPDPEVFTIKGSPLNLVIEREGQVRSWDGEPLTPGDRVQLTWTSPHAGYLVVLARSRQGEVEILVPREGAEAAPVGASATPVPIGPSFQIPQEDAPLDVISILSPRPLAVDPLARRFVEGAAPHEDVGITSHLRIELGAGP